MITSTQVVKMSVNVTYLTVLFRTTLTQTITLHNRLLLLHGFKPFTALSQKLLIQEMVLLRGENKSVSHPHNLAVSFMDSFQNLRQSPPSLLYGTPCWHVHTVDVIYMYMYTCDFVFFKGKYYSPCHWVSSASTV